MRFRRWRLRTGVILLGRRTCVFVRLWIVIDEVVRFRLRVVLNVLGAEMAFTRCF